MGCIVKNKDGVVTLALDNGSPSQVLNDGQQIKVYGGAELGQVESIPTEDGEPAEEQPQGEPAEGGEAAPGGAPGESSEAEQTTGDGSGEHDPATGGEGGEPTPA